jgi:amino acid transporter
LGFFLFVFAAVAVVVGLMLSAGMIAAAMFVVARDARRRPDAWRVAVIGSGIAALVVIVLIQLLPTRPVTPGSDYDALAFNWIMLGFAWGLAPGLAAVAGAAISRMRPRRERG